MDTSSVGFHHTQVIEIPFRPLRDLLLHGWYVPYGVSSVVEEDPAQDQGHRQEQKRSLAVEHDIQLAPDQPAHKPASFAIPRCCLHLVVIRIAQCLHHVNTLGKKETRQITGSSRSGSLSEGCEAEAR